VALIRTERLRLRPLALSDARALARLWRGDVEAVRMTERLPEPCTEPAARDWTRYHQGPGEHAFAIETLGDGEFVGCISLSRAGDEAGLGYLVGRPFRDRGYAKEAGRAVLDHARGLGIRAVVAETFPENPASARVLVKLGFTAEGETERDLPLRGGRRRLLRFVRRFARPGSGPKEPACGFENGA
jgi:RimJ/RimL family protein N-acetyltransferase